MKVLKQTKKEQSLKKQFTEEELHNLSTMAEVIVIEFKKHFNKNLVYVKTKSHKPKQDKK